MTPIRLPETHFGITPTCWTNDDFPLLGDDIPFEQCVSEIRLAGFEGCSIGHKFPTDVDALNTALALRELSVTEPWVSTFFTVPGMREPTIAAFRERMDFLDAIQGPVKTRSIGVAEFGNSIHLMPISLSKSKPVFTEDHWRALTQGLDEIGRLAKERDFQLVYHPHMGTGVQTQDDVDTLMRRTNAQYVHLLLDTGHLHWAGGDPVAVINAHADRIRHVHLKNIRPAVRHKPGLASAGFEEFVRAGIFTVPGDRTGDVPFPAVLKALESKQYKGWLVVEAEQDPHGRRPPLYYAKLAREYLRKELGR
ncbi:myo-inosose-2 dehydratase [Streptomyces sp. ID05-39B]|uniref:myo-inosose-2 dehydratase n=1 Tax=Streptomyces sp. ID05-39B TaxID=3028664 RepID=UPI0029A97334|nr:myo-inosose-2 dehydratase [Streptomyces sp. ID05-39B]MDX3528978.1 myo-inosose-2 dehydratase [Streptomyces sp. ID05-39B]